MPHLFRIDAYDIDGSYTYIVSAESDSESGAQDLAEAAVLDDIGTDDDPGRIEGSVRLGATDTDIFERINTL